MSGSVQYALAQAVDFDNLGDVREVAEAQVDAVDPDATLEISIGDLDHGGSAAVALMIALFRRAHAKGKTIHFVDIPPAIVNIISVSGMADVLPLELPDTEIAKPASQEAD